MDDFILFPISNGQTMTSCMMLHPTIILCHQWGHDAKKMILYQETCVMEFTNKTKLYCSKNPM